MKRRVLFVAEAVTLAQVARLRVLAGSLDPARYEVHFASARFDELVFADTAFQRWSIPSVTPAAVERAVKRGGRIYSRRVLERYLEADRELLRRVRPHLVVGDLRWSLAVAAPLAGVPLASLINAYWSPYAVRDAFPMPDHPIVSLLGEKLAGRYFPKALPWFFRSFAAPVNAMRRRHGLPEIGDLPALLTYGDYTLYPDVPELTPVRGAPPSHVFLGPVPWAPALSCPPLHAVRTRPLVYVTLGSSGRLRSLRAVLEGLAQLEVDVLLATAGRITPRDVPPNTTVVDFAPGERAAERAALVVCNGGSTTAYQALAAGRPVLGVAFNFDQHLAMRAVEQAGAGLAVRSSSVSAAAVRQTAERLLHEPSFAASARQLRDTFAAYDATSTFAQIVARATSAAAAASA